MATIDRINKKVKKYEEEKTGRKTGLDASMSRIEELTNELRTTNKIAYPDTREIVGQTKPITAKTSKGKEDKSFLSTLGYVGKEFLTEGFGGLSKIPYAITSEIGSNLDKGEEKSFGKSLLDTWQSVSSLSNPVMALTNLGKNVYENAKEQSQTDKSLGNKILGTAFNTITEDNVLDKATQTIGTLLPDGSGEAVNKAGETVLAPYKSLREDLDKEKAQQGKIGQFAGTVSGVIGNMGPAIAATALTKNPTTGLAMMGLGAKGGATDEALRGGADLETATKYGSVIGATEILTEKITGGLKVFGGGALDDVVLGSTTKKGLVNGIKNDLGKKIAIKGYEYGGEVAEELIADVVGMAAQRGSWNEDAGYTLEDVGETTAVTLMSTLILNILTKGKVGVVNANGTTLDSAEVVNNTIAEAEQELGRPLTDVEKGFVASQVDSINKVTSTPTQSVEDIDNQIMALEEQLNSNLSDAEYDRISNQIRELEIQAEQLEQNGPATTQGVETNSLVDAPSNTLNNDNITKTVEELQTELKNTRDTQKRSEIALQIRALEEGYNSVQEYTAALEQERQESLIAPVRSQESPVIEDLSPVKSGQETTINSQAVDNNQVNNDIETNEQLQNEGAFLNAQNENIPKAKKIEERVQGDELLDAQDLIEEVKSVGANVDDNGYVTVYHATTPENAEQIKASGKMKSNEPAVFFSTSKNAQQSEGRGGATLEFKIPAEKLLLDDIFSDNADVKIPFKNFNTDALDVSEYLVENNQEQHKSIEKVANSEQNNIPTKQELDNLEDTRKNKSGSEYASAFFDLRDKYGQANLYKGINEYNSNAKNSSVSDETTSKVQEDLAPIKEATKELKTAKKEIASQIKKLEKKIDEFKVVTKEQLEDFSNQYQEDLKSLKEDIVPLRNNLTQEENARFDELEQLDNAGFIDSEELSELENLRAIVNNEDINDIDFGEYFANQYGSPEFVTPKVVQEKIKSDIGMNDKEAATLYDTIANSDSFTKDDLHKVISDYLSKSNEVTYENSEVREVRNYIRSTKIDMSYLKSQFASSKDYNHFRKSNFGKIKMANSGMGVDVFYQELANEYPQYFDSSVKTEMDQLAAIVDFMNNNPIYEVQEGAPIPSEVIEDYTNDIYDSVINAEAQKALDAELDSYIDNFKTEEIIAPVAPVAKEEILSPVATEEKIIPKDPTKESSYEDDTPKTRKQLQRRLDTVNKQIERIGGLESRALEEVDKYNKKLTDIQEQIAIDKVKNGSLQSMDEFFYKNIVEGLYEKSAPVIEKYDKYHFKLQELTEERNQLEEQIENTPEKKARKAIQQELVNKTGIIEMGLDNANRMSTAMLNNTDPIRIQEMVFGQEVGAKINEEFFQKIKDNTSEKTRWLNEQRTRIKELGIKARSKEAAAVQKYGEKKWVSEKNGEVFPYGDYELSLDFPEVETQNKIKKAAKEIRGLYDEYLDTVNPILTEMGYDPIPKRPDYFRHFQELNDKFSEFGIPLNLNDMKANDLPTDINGLTADFKPGKNFFANALHRTGLKTSYDAITGIDGYLEGVGNLIYHTEDVQRLRGFENYIRDTYGEQHGYENLENLTETQRAKRLQAIENKNLSNYASWLHEYTNQLAGKKSLIDRSLESLVGRKIYSLLDTANKQVGANMIGFNIGSAMTNAIAGVQAIAKTNKKAAVKGLADTVTNIFRKDGFVEKNGFLTSRFGSDRLSKTPWEKIQDVGFMFMSGTDNFISNFVVRSKFNELKAKGYTDSEAHTEAGKFASRIMADRSQGAQPTLYNSKMLGILTKFQYEVNNQVYSMFYDTFQESKAKANGNTVRTAASMASTLGQLAVFTHIFGAAFEKMAGYNPTFDIIDIIAKALGLDDDEDSEDTLTDNLGQAFKELVNDLPYSNLIFDGGRIPVGEAFPIKELFSGKDEYGNDKSRLKTIGETIPYWFLPAGYSQIKKTTGGLAMFDDELPVAGSYTDGGNLRFSVEDTPINRIQAGIFGKWANEEARKYIDSDFETIKKSNIEELAELNMKSSEYRKYKKGLSEAKAAAKDNKDLSQAQAVFDYIESLNVSSKQKSIMLENQFNSSLDDEAEAKLDSLNMSTDEKISFYTSKSAISSLENDYKNEVEKLKDKYGENSTTYKDKVESLSKERQKKVIEQVLNANLNDEQKTYLYTKYYSSEESLDKITSSGTSVDDYLNYKLDTIDYTSDEDEDGDTINGSLARKKINYLLSSNLSTNDIQTIYENDILSGFDDEKKYKPYKAVKAMGVDINSWLNYETQEFEADYNSKGNAIRNSKKNKVIKYVNTLDLTIPQKAAIIRTQYSSFDDYNKNIVSYVDSLDISRSEKVDILESLDMKIYEDGTVRW